MSLRKTITRYFVPFFVLFFVLSLLSQVSSIQKLYYPVFEKLAVAVMTSSMDDIYFKAKPKGPQTDTNFNEVSVLFNSKNQLKAMAQAARQQGVQPRFSYKGFNIKIDETFVAPLLFLWCLLLFTPGRITKRVIAFLAGTVLVLGFSWLLVYFKGLYMVGKSGARDIAYSQNDINFFEYLHFFFSPVTIVTVVLLVWVLVAFRRSNLKEMLAITSQD